jgi:hypothetical protein
MSKINFPSNPSGGAEHKWRSRRRFNYDNTRGGWAASGGSLASDAPALNSNTSIADFNDSTGLANKLTGKATLYNSYYDLPTEAYKGTFAYVADTNKLYMWTGDNPAPPTALYGDRGMFMGGGGMSSTIPKHVEWVDLVTGGNAGNFTETFNVVYSACATTNGQRAVAVGSTPGGTAVRYISIPDPTTETVLSGWSLNKGRRDGAATSDAVYGVFFTINGTSDPLDIDAIEYITIDTTGTSTIFGNLTEATNFCGDSAASNGTRGIHAGGTTGGTFSTNGYVNTIDYITIATPSNAQDFGDLTVKRAQLAACHDDTRAVFTGGQAYSGGGQGLDTADYVTIATTGQATSFGTLSRERYNHSSVSNGTYGHTVGGYISGGPEGFVMVREITQFTIQTNATSTSIADLQTNKIGIGATSGFAS